MVRQEHQTTPINKVRVRVLTRDGGPEIVKFWGIKSNSNLSGLKAS